MFTPSKYCRFFALLLVLGLVLAGCGTKGPLYIPEKEYPQNNT